jgi:Biopolymer transport protein ExbD/TolR
MRLPTYYRSNSLDLPLAAMINVVFLLLFYLLWTSGGRVPESDMIGHLWVPSIGNAAASTDLDELLFDELIIRIGLAAGGQPELRLNHAVMKDLAELKTKLSEIAEISTQPTVVVQPDIAVPMEMAITVYDVTRSAGFQRVFLKVSP